MKITFDVGEDAPAATACETTLDILNNTWRQFCLLLRELRLGYSLLGELLNFFYDPERHSLLTVCTGLVLWVFWALIWSWSNVALVRWIVAFQSLRIIYQRPGIRFVLVPLCLYLSSMVLRLYEYETGSRDLQSGEFLPGVSDIYSSLAIMAVLVALWYFLPRSQVAVDTSAQTEEQEEQQEEEEQQQDEQHEEEQLEEEENDRLERRQQNQLFWFALRHERSERRREQREWANFQRARFEERFGQRPSSPTIGTGRPRSHGARPRGGDIRRDVENAAREGRSEGQETETAVAVVGVQATEGVEAPLPAETNTNEAVEEPETPAVGNNDTNGTKQRDDNTEETKNQTTLIETEPAQLSLVFYDPVVIDPIESESVPTSPVVSEASAPEPPTLTLVRLASVVIEPVEEPVEPVAVAPEIIPPESSTITPEITAAESSTPTPEVTAAESSTTKPAQETSVVNQPAESEPVVLVKPTRLSLLENLAQRGAITLNSFAKTSKESGNNSIVHASKEKKPPYKLTRRRVYENRVPSSPSFDRKSSITNTSRRSIFNSTFPPTTTPKVEEATSADSKAKKSLREISAEVRRTAWSFAIAEVDEEEDIWSATSRELSPVSPLASRSSQNKPTTVPDQPEYTRRVRFEDEFPVVPSIEAPDPQPQVEDRPATSTTRDYTTSSEEPIFPGLGPHEPLPQGGDGPATSNPRDYSSFEPKPDSDSHGHNDDDNSDSDDGFPPPAGGAISTWNFGGTLHGGPLYDGPLFNKPRNDTASLSSLSSDHTDSDIDARLRLPSISPAPLSPNQAHTMTGLAESLNTVFPRPVQLALTVPEGAARADTTSWPLTTPARPEVAPVEPEEDAELKALLENTTEPLDLTPPEEIFENMMNGSGSAAPNPFAGPFTPTQAGGASFSPFVTASTPMQAVLTPDNPFAALFPLAGTNSTPRNLFATVGTPVGTGTAPSNPFATTSAPAGTGSTLRNPFAAVTTPVGTGRAPNPFAVVPGSQRDRDIDAALDALLSGTGVVEPSQPNDETMEWNPEHETVSMGDEDLQMEDTVTTDAPENMEDRDRDNTMTDVVAGDKRDREMLVAASTTNTDVEMGEEDEGRGAPVRVTEDEQMQYEFNVDLAADLEAALLEDQAMTPAPQPPIPAHILMPPPPPPSAPRRPIPPPITIPSFGRQMPAGTSSANSSSTPVFDYSTISLPVSAQSTPGYRAVTTTELNPRNIFTTPTDPSPSIAFSDAQFGDFYTGRIVGERRTLTPRRLRGAASVPTSTIAQSFSLPAVPEVNETAAVANSAISSDPDARASGPVSIPMSAPATMPLFPPAPFTMAAPAPAHAPAPVPASTSTNLEDQVLHLAQVMAQEEAMETAPAQQQGQPQPQAPANVEPIPAQTPTAVQPETPRRILPLPRGRLTSEGEIRVIQPSTPARPVPQSPLVNVAPIQMGGMMFPGGNQVTHPSPTQAATPSGSFAAELEKARKAREEAFQKKKAESIEKLKARYVKKKEQKPSIFSSPKVKPSSASKTRDQALAERERTLASPNLLKNFNEAEKKKKKEEEEKKKKEEEEKKRAEADVMDEAEDINLKRNRDGESSPDPEAKRTKSDE